ncbi:MAG: universal stress protein [Dehalococcoidia bacterium]|nr:universal stress protein [Dehalococcoidia bacterium]
MFKEILVTLDGSEYSERVLPYVQDLATLTPTRVTLLAVIHVDTSLPGSASAAPTEGQLRGAHTYLDEHAQPLRDAGVSEVSVEVRSGIPSRVIVETARELQADLIAMATQGVGAENEEGLGGTASKVLVLAPCPVYVVHTRRPSPPRSPAEERWQEEGGANVG